MKKKWIIILLATIMLCENSTVYALEHSEITNSVPVEYEADITEVRVHTTTIDGTDIYWSISGDMLTLATSGESAMIPDFPDGNHVPWVRDKSNIRKIVIQTGITSIGNYAFSSMDKLEEVEIQSKTLSKIGAHAFQNCELLKKINLPDTVNDMGIYAFAECKRLKETSSKGFIIPENLHSIPEYAFADCDEIENVTISKNVEKISMCAFYSCGSMKNVDFAGNKLACIEEYAFADSGLETITFPASVRDIYAYAFSGCHSLKKVGFLTSINDSLNVENDVFNNCGILTFYTLGLGPAYDYVSANYPENHQTYISFSNANNFEIKILGDTTYNGSQIKPKVKIQYLLNNGSVLVENEDYTLSYENNVKVGKKAVLIIKGKNGYQGNRRLSFTIQPANLQKQASVKSIPAQSYTGKQITPTVEVKVNGSVLKKDVDYKVRYNNNINVGNNASIIIDGIGNYTGRITKQFSINSDISENQANSASKTKITIKPQSYTGKKLTPKVTVVIGKKTLREGTDYKVSYSNNKKIGKKAKVTINGIGNYKGKITKYFTIVPPKAKVKVNGNKLRISNYASGADVYLTFTVEGSNKKTTLLWQAKKYKAKKCVDLTQLKNKYKGKMLKIKVYMKVDSLEGAYSKSVTLK